MTAMNQTNRALLDFIAHSPTAYHAADNLARRLAGEGYQELSEGEKWALERGKGYFVRRNLSTLVAFRVPLENPRGFQITAAHSDSPAFKLKHAADMAVDEHYTRLNVEKYGGMLCATWLDRPLSVAGKVVVRTAGGVESRLVDLDRDLLMIPNLAIHMDRTANEGKAYSIQKDMLPLLGDERAKGKLAALVAQAAGAEEEDILDADLFLYCRTPGTVWGAEEEYLSSPRLDDLQCAFCCVEGFLQGDHPRTMPVCAVFDNEEVGSGTKQGAASTVLSDVLQRVCRCLGMDGEDYLAALASSFMVSADNAHAAHPNRLDVADPTHHPHMNHGVVIKYSANQKYATDSVSGAIFRSICSRAGVEVQTFHNHSDTLGGSTLGNLSNSQVSLNTVDIGLAQLAMHSACEIAGAEDTQAMIAALAAFYSTLVEDQGQGKYALDSAR